MTLCKTLHGVANPDYDYQVRVYEGDKVVWTCPYYQRWANMITRCYYSNQRLYTPSYKGVNVCSSWMTFTNFKGWMLQQDWQGKELDKDLLGDGSLYSPETCCFIDKRLNLKLRKFLSNRPVGVSWHGQKKKFRAYTYHHITGKQIHLGLFDSRFVAQEVADKARKDELLAILNSEIVPNNLKFALSKKLEKEQ